jgi:hypothetical protein
VSRRGLTDVESIDAIGLSTVDQGEIDLLGVIGSGVGATRVDTGGAPLPLSGERDRSR